MKKIYNYIQEKLVINKDSKTKKYSCQPKDKKELRKIIKERLKKDKNANLNDIDVSNIIDISGLFNGLDPHNIDISKWDVSNITDMQEMFFNCKNFNSDISKWDVSKCTDMFYMFGNCYKFNCDLNNWDISNVEDKRGIFHNCESLQSPKWFNGYTV